MIDDCAHQFVRMESALHERFNLTGAGHGNGGLRGRIAMLGGNDLVRRKIELGLLRRSADFVLRPDQHGRLSAGAPPWRVGSPPPQGVLAQVRVILSRSVIA